MSMAQGASLSVLDGGSIKLASVTTIDGTLTAHGGSITISGVPARAGLSTLPDLTLGAHAMLDVSGQWINDTGFGGGITGALYINGGSVSLSAFNLSKALSYDPTTQIVTAEDRSGSIVLQHGSIIDVSSGGYVGSNGKLAIGSDGLPEGKGGNLSLATYTGSWASNVVHPISHSPSANQLCTADRDERQRRHGRRDLCRRPLAGWQLHAAGAGDRHRRTGGTGHFGGIGGPGRHRGAADVVLHQ